MNNIRLSSDFLYTYTTKFDNMKLMLKHGLRYSLNKEKIPYINSEQHNFIICFCDILPEQSDFHKSVYGNYSIAFSKKWGIDNGITPIRYIHEKSTGATPDYIYIKNDLREARNALINGNQLDYFLSLILHSNAREKGLLTKDSIFKEIGNTALIEYMGEIDKTFAEKRTKFGDNDLRNFFNEWIIPILHLLEKTVDELEKRDALLRLYQGEFRHIKNKILYDEREWRSVKFITEVEKKSNPLIFDEALKNEFLPEKYNLKFVTNDIAVILVETNSEKQELKKFIIDELSHLKGAENKVFTFNEHIVTV